MELPNDGPPADRILQRNAPPPAERLYCPEWPDDPESRAQYTLMAKAMGESMVRIFLFNKAHAAERHCPNCNLRYKRPDNPVTRAEHEQELSGICSSVCFYQMNGPDGFDLDEWLGTSADRVIMRLPDRTEN